MRRFHIHVRRHHPAILVGARAEFKRFHTTSCRQRGVRGQASAIVIPVAMSLRAPLAVPVEIRTDGKSSDLRRVFRLARNVGEDGLRLARPVPFDIGRPVAVAFTLPDFPTPIVLRAVLALTEDDGEGEGGGRELTFLSAPSEDRQSINRYVADRLGLPPL
jgi:hypothetical protein